MAKYIRQYRYYSSTGESSSKNQPEDISPSNLISGSVFFSNNSLGAITQLGIQSLPGTKFYLNDGVDPIIVGSTGIYELELEGISEITALSFDEASVRAINNLNSGYLIVDAIYDAED